MSMKRSVLVAALGFVLSAAPSFGQNPAPAAPAPARPAAPAAPAATQPAPAPARPPAAAPAVPQAGPARPFPAGAKIAYVNLQRVANESAEGKASTTRVEALSQKKLAELNQRNQALQGLQQKLAQGGAIMNETARGQLEKDIERTQLDIQRAQQDAQREVQDLQAELQEEFQRKLVPIIEKVAAEKQLQYVLSQLDSGVIWADTGLDITGDIIKLFDEAGKPAGK